MLNALRKAFKQSVNAGLSAGDSWWLANRLEIRWVAEGICRSRKDDLIDTQNQVAKYPLLSSPSTCEKRLFGRRWEHDGLEGHSQC